MGYVAVGSWEGKCEESYCEGQLHQEDCHEGAFYQENFHKEVSCWQSHLARLWLAVHPLEQPACGDFSFSQGKRVNALTTCVPIPSPCPWFSRVLLLQVRLGSLSWARRLFLRTSGRGATRSGKCCWMSCWCSWSRSSFRCLERVLSVTSRPPLQRMEHVHQAIGRSKR